MASSTSERLSDRLTREYQTEIVGVVLLTLGFWAAFRLTHRNALTAGVFVVAAAVLVAASPARRLVRGHLWRADIRRRWSRATVACGINVPVSISRISRTATGYELRVHVGNGVAFGDLVQRQEKLMDSLGARDLILRRKGAASGTVEAIMRAPRPTVSPWDGPRRHDGTLWEPIPFGSSDRGELVTVSLPYRSLLIGGRPDSGKSNALQVIIAAAALDPTVRLHLIDSKRVELSHWKDCANHFGCTLVDANRILGELVALMEDRYRALEEEGLRKVARGDDRFPLHVVVVDELMRFTDASDPAGKKEFNQRLQEVAALGRAAGIVLVLATQKPQASVVPSQIRDLIHYRLALDSATPQASDTILGSGWAARGHDASTIGTGNPGRGWWLEETANPQMVQLFYLSDERIDGLVQQAKMLRGVR